MRASLGGLAAWLPRGQGLPCDSWRRRHRGLLALLWAHVPALALVGMLFGHTSLHGLLHSLPLVAFAALGHWARLSRRLQAVAVSLGLVSAAAIGVHVSGGLTEAHFLFFVLLIGLALYEDWLIFLLAIGYVVVHHGLASSVGLGRVYSHEGADWMWAGVHGFFVLFAAALCIVSWRASEQARHELRLAEREKLDSQLREAQRLESLGLLAGGIAHDFNNLLVGVLGNAALVREDLPAGSPLAPFVEQIELAGKRAAALTRQMLAYSGNSRLESEPMALSSVVEEIVQLVAPAISKQTRVELELETAVPTIVRGDSGQLGQVVMNLVTNASESLPDGTGTVTVRTGVAAGSQHVFLEVSDTGCGMSPETQGRIFEPFYSTKFTGRGLGLAAVSGIVRSHEGSIHVVSAPGEGTTFRVLLPLAAAGPDTAAAPEREAVPPGAGRVLVVDDEPSVLQFARRLLERNGYEVVAAASGSEAVEWFGRGERPLTAAIVDLTMPGLNGLETIRALRRHAPDLPVILSSGYATESPEAGLLERMRFIQKPYANDELLELLGEVIGEAALAVA